HEMESWWWGLETSVLCFDVREDGKDQKWPPLHQNARWRAGGGDWRPLSCVLMQGRMGKVKNSPPFVSKHEIEGWWWGLGTSISCFNVREGGNDRVGGGCDQQMLLFVYK